MKRSLVLTVVAGAVVALLMGCGGAGNPGGDNPAVTPASEVSPAAIDPALVGTGVLVHAKLDGADAAPSTFDNWPAATAREVVVLNSNGTEVVTYYNASGGVTGSNSGTWTASGGNGTTNFGGGPHPWKYAVSGNVATLTKVDGGHTKVGRFAKVVTLTGHDAALVGTWKPATISRNGVPKALAFLSSDPTYRKFARRFDVAGKSQRYFLNGLEFRVPLPNLQNWASGGGVVKYGAGPYDAALYTIQTGTLTIWQLDDNGNTLRIWSKPYGAAGGHDSRFLSPWHAVSGTVNGVPASLSAVFGWDDPTTTSMRITFFADGTAEERDLASGVPSHGSLMRWSTSGTNMTLVTSDDIVAGTFSFTSSTVITMSWNDDGGGAKTAVWNKGP